MQSKILNQSRTHIQMFSSDAVCFIKSADAAGRITISDLDERNFGPFSAAGHTWSLTLQPSRSFSEIILAFPLYLYSIILMVRAALNSGTVTQPVSPPKRPMTPSAAG